MPSPILPSIFPFFGPSLFLSTRFSFQFDPLFGPPPRVFLVIYLPCIQYLLLLCLCVRVLVCVRACVCVCVCVHVCVCIKLLRPVPCSVGSIKFVPYFHSFIVPPSIPLFDLSISQPFGHSFIRSIIHSFNHSSITFIHLFIHSFRCKF